MHAQFTAEVLPVPLLCCWDFGRAWRGRLQGECLFTSCILNYRRERQMSAALRGTE